MINKILFGNAMVFFGGIFLLFYDFPMGLGVLAVAGGAVICFEGEIERGVIKPNVQTTLFNNPIRKVKK
jgi:hypothetical protein